MRTRRRGRSANADGRAGNPRVLRIGVASDASALAAVALTFAIAAFYLPSAALFDR